MNLRNLLNQKWGLNDKGELGIEIHDFVTSSCYNAEFAKQLSESCLMTGDLLFNK